MNVSKKLNKIEEDIMTVKKVLKLGNPKLRENSNEV